MIAAEIAFQYASLANEGGAGDHKHSEVSGRDLRYWSHRRETAELSIPEPESDVIRFGMSVDLVSPDGKKKVTWKITGEDEADAKHGKISHVSPMAIALFGKKAGDAISLNDHEWVIASFESDEEGL